MLDEKLLSHLPAPSRQKVEILASERDAAQAEVRRTSDVLQEARQAHILVQGRGRHMRQIGPGYDQVSAETSKAQRRWGETAENRIVSVPADAAALDARIGAMIADARGKQDRAEAAHDRAVAARQRLAFLDASERWLARMIATGVQLRHAPLPPVKTATRGEIERIHADLAKLDDAWRSAEAAPDTREAYRQRAIREIETMAAKGALAVNLRNRGESPLDLKRRLSHELFRDAQPRTVTIGDKSAVIPDVAHVLLGEPAPTLVWLHRDTILVRVNELIDAADDVGALGFDAREKEFARISAAKLQLEFEEEAVICAASNAGLQIARRRDADPGCVLEVQES